LPLPKSQWPAQQVTQSEQHQQCCTEKASRWKAWKLEKLVCAQRLRAAGKNCDSATIASSSWDWKRCFSGGVPQTSIYMRWEPYARTSAAQQSKQIERPNWNCLYQCHSQRIFNLLRRPGLVSSPSVSQMNWMNIRCLFTRMGVCGKGNSNWFDWGERCTQKNATGPVVVFHLHSKCQEALPKYSIYIYIV
jgi:hypothetical protein